MNSRLLFALLILTLALSGCQTTPTYDEETGNREINLEAGKYENSPANVYIQLAIAYINEQDFNTALTNAKKAVAKDRSNPNAYNVLALIYQRLGQNTKAENNYRRALSISPNDPYINNTYGSFLCSLKKLDKALIHYKKTESHPLYTKKWVPLTNAGICALRQDNLELAQEYLRKALQSNGKFEIALYNMIDVSVQQENYWSARAYLQRYLEVAQHDAKTLWWGIQTERVLGDRDKQASYELLLRSKFPDSEEAYKLNTDRT